MAYRIDDNMERIKADKDVKLALAIRFALDDIHRISRPKTPRLSGQLRGDVTKRVMGKRGSIKWGKHYAWYQERGYTNGKVRRYTTPGTQAHFAETSVKEVARNARQYFRKAGL